MRNDMSGRVGFLPALKDGASASNKVKEHETSTLSIKAMCQKIVIDYVSDKKNRGERLFRL